VPDWGGNDGDERSRSFAKTDQQVSALKEGIARQREVIKQAKLRGHSTAAAEAARQALEARLSDWFMGFQARSGPSVAPPRAREAAVGSGAPVAARQPRNV
jgi:hypothetical protein